MSEEASIPAGWMHRPDGAPADDLDLAVLLVNSVDLLEDPPDRLTSVAWYASALRRAGHPELASALREEDLDPLRELRALLRLVFTSETAEEAASILNPMLVSAGAVAVLVPGVGGAGRGEGEGTARLELRVSPDARGFAALAARLPAAAAARIADSGVRRIGTCAGAPCECAYVDRSRSGSRRFCCDWCNDRAAAAAYRRRRKAAAAEG